MRILELANNRVNFNVCKAIIDAQPVIDAYYKEHGAHPVITSANDGTHSRQTAHARGLAIDLRSKDLIPQSPPKARWDLLMRFAEGLSAALNKNLTEGTFYVVLESTHVNMNGRQVYEHIHVEYAEPGRRPNIVGLQLGKVFYFRAPQNEGAQNGKIA